MVVSDNVLDVMGVGTVCDPTVSCTTRIGRHYAPGPEYLGEDEIALPQRGIAVTVDDVEALKENALE